MEALAPRRAGAALAVLSTAAFVFVTTEVMPIGLLTVIADDLHRTRAEIGLLMTGYATVVVLMSLPMARLTRRVPRRLLFGGTLGAFTVATVVSALAPGYGALLAARLVIAVTQATFWTVVGSTATALFPPARRGRTVARVSLGASLAPVLGVPVGTWLGQQLGWRFAFLVIAAIGLATCVAVLALLPSTPPPAPAAARGTGADRRRYALLLAVIAVGVTGAFTAQTYVTPFLLDVGRFSAGSLGPLLLVSGLGGVTGALVVGRFLDPYPWAALTVPMLGLVTAFLALFTAGGTQAVVVVALAVNGACFSAFAAAVQNRTLQVVPDNPDMASAGSGSAFNVGIALGSSVGGLIITDLGVARVMAVGAALTAAASGLLLADRALPRHTLGRPSAGADPASDSPVRHLDGLAAVHDTKNPTQ